MMTTSKAFTVAGLVLSAALAGACEGGRGAGSSESEATDEAPEAQVLEAAAAPIHDSAVLDLERVLRRVERGGAAPADATSLAKVVAEAKLPAEALDRASLGLSRALEAAGDADGAVRAIEDMMKRHGGDPMFESHDAARSRLRLLLSGTEEAPPTFDQNMEPMAPVAKALAPYFPEDDRGATLLDVLSVGRAPTSTDPHGIFNVRAAKRQIEESECSVCDVDVRVQRSLSRIDSWVELPLQAGERRADMPNPDRSMVVVYFDLIQNRVPSRYDAYLAVPSDETVARLERGEAFVAVRERPGKKPLVLLAAPRAGQLDQVEAAFAAMTSIPQAPVTVEVNKRLFPPEIQGVVRASFGRFRACYETLLKADPKAAGTVKAKFRILEDGSVDKVSNESSFEDKAIGRCIDDSVAKLRFEANRQTTDVTYPIVFSP